MLARVAVMVVAGLAAARGWSQGPQIVTQPQSQTVGAGANVTFNVTATGAVPLTYQWQFDGTNIGLAADTITTFAGGGAGGDGSLATNASLYSPRGVAVDALGNVFIADQQHNTIRKVDTNGIISTVAGSGLGGFGGDSGPATAASLQFPFGVAVDHSGNLFIDDFYNQRIRKVGTNGIITTVAGSGPSGPGQGAYFGDGGPATSARLNEPECVTLDAAGNLFIADYLNNRIRKVDTNGIITTVAGGGTNGLGDGGQATNASLAGPNGVAVDAFGDVFIADTANSRIREVNTSGIITTLAGGGTNVLGDGAPATNASLIDPTGVALDGFGNFYIVEEQGSRIRKVNAGGIITTVAGDGSNGYSGDGGPAADASLNFPYQMAFDNSGNILIADQANFRVREVTLSGGPSFTLQNVTTNDDGNYTVIVSNQYSSATSAVAVLTVNPPECTPAPAGLVGWWAGEGNAADNTGLNNGTLVGGVTFAPGEVGQAFNLNGSGQYVDVPDSPSLNPTNSVTIEAWINPLQFLNSPIIKKNIPSAGEYTLEMDPSGGVLFGVYLNGGWVTIISPPVPLGQWTHVVGVYNGANVSVYVNGALSIAPKPATGTIVPVAVDLQIGHDSAIPSRYFAGGIDEASVYSTALSAAQIQAIYNSTSAGKCAPPPFITSQPQGEAVYPGGTVSFTVGAGGGQPLSYQWQENMTNIPVSVNPTATSATLVLPDVSLAQSGYAYSVQVMNGGGVTNSASAMLTVLSPGSCYPVPAGIISWWPGEFSGMDIAGSNNAALVGGVTFAPGEVNEAFRLNGTSQYVDVPDSPSLNPTSSVTLEAWINPAQFLNSPPIIKKDNPVSGGYTLELNASGGVVFGVYVNGGWLTATAPPIPLNQWTHVAGAYNGLSASVYVNGVLAATANGAGTIVPAAGHLQIGHDSANAIRYFTGLIDEPTVYGRALSPVEIEDIYLSGTTGKCSEPEISMQPQSQVGYSGGSLYLNVTVAGVGPFTYQWNYNGTAITGATNGTLALGDTQVGNSGSYTVTISNPYGTVTSSAATIIVNPPGLALALYPGLTISGAPGATYGVQYITSLTNTNDWIGLANVTLTQTNQLFFDLTPATQQHRFYRILPGPIPIP